MCGITGFINYARNQDASALAGSIALGLSMNLRSIAVLVGAVARFGRR